MTDILAPPDAPPADEPLHPRAPRKLVAGLTALTIGMLSILGWLFGPGASEPKAPVKVAALPSTDGTLVVVDLPRLVLKTFRPLEGKREVEFHRPRRRRGQLRRRASALTLLDRTADAHLLRA